MLSHMVIAQYQNFSGIRTDLHKVRAEISGKLHGCGALAGIQFIIIQANTTLRGSGRNQGVGFLQKPTTGKGIRGSQNDGVISGLTADQQILDTVPDHCVVVILPGG